MTYPPRLSTRRKPVAASSRPATLARSLARLEREHVALLLALSTRGSLRVALLANAASLFFFAFIETADVLLERAGSDLGILTWEEFNYGIPVLLILFAATSQARLPRREIAG